MPKTAHFAFRTTASFTEYEKKQLFRLKEIFGAHNPCDAIRKAVTVCDMVAEILSKETVSDEEIKLMRTLLAPDVRQALINQWRKSKSFPSGQTTTPSPADPSSS